MTKKVMTTETPAEEMKRLQDTLADPSWNAHDTAARKKVENRMYLIKRNLAKNPEYTPRARTPKPSLLPVIDSETTAEEFARLKAIIAEPFSIEHRAFRKAVTDRLHVLKRMMNKDANWLPMSKRPKRTHEEIKVDQLQKRRVRYKKFRAAHPHILVPLQSEEEKESRRRERALASQIRRCRAKNPDWQPSARIRAEMDAFAAANPNWLTKQMQPVVSPDMTDEEKKHAQLEREKERKRWRAQLKLTPEQKATKAEELRLKRLLAENPNYRPKSHVKTEQEKAQQEARRKEGHKVAKRRHNLKKDPNYKPREEVDAETARDIQVDKARKYYQEHKAELSAREKRKREEDPEYYPAVKRRQAQLRQIKMLDPHYREQTLARERALKECRHGAKRRKCHQGFSDATMKLFPDMPFEHDPFQIVPAKTELTRTEFVL